MCMGVVMCVGVSCVCVCRDVCGCIMCVCVL